MFQKAEVGKYRSQATIANAMIGKICITPNNEEYKLVEVKKVGRKSIWIYEVTKPVLKIKYESVGRVDLLELMEWIRKNS